MAILTATEVTIYSNITATVGTIISRQMIKVIQEKIVMLTNNYFVTDLYLQDFMTFYPSTNSILAGNYFSDRNFVAGDEIFVYRSYRNDGYKMVESVNGKNLVIASTDTLYDELSGRSILISVVRWPFDIKKIAAEMIAYDYDEAPKRQGLNSRSLGPLSESYSSIGMTYGYPNNIADVLGKYTIARLM